MKAKAVLGRGLGCDSYVKARTATHLRRNEIPPEAQPTIDGATKASSVRRSDDRLENRAGRTKVAASSCRWYVESVEGRAEARACSPSCTLQKLPPSFFCTH